jgi:hypothetical protein
MELNQKPGSGPSLPTLSKLWRGRIGRWSYWWKASIYFALAAALAGAPFIGIIFFLLFCSTVVKRLHDINESGWWALLAWVPPISLYLTFKPGTRGDNRFGAAPGRRDNKEREGKTAGRVLTTAPSNAPPLLAACNTWPTCAALPASNATQAPLPPQRDTRRSWRVMRRAVVWLCSGAAAILGFCAADSAFGPGNSKGEIAEFESSLTEYIHANNAANYPPLTFHDFEYVLVGSQSVADGKGHRATADLIAAEARCAAAFKNLSGHNQNHARLLFKDDPKRDDALYPVFTAAEFKEWATTSQVVLKSLGVAAISAIAAWLAAGLLVVALAFAWWFFIDRLREIAGAMKGEQTLT